MSDIKLFQIKNNTVKELEGKSVQIEKSLQSLIEHHLEEFLGIKFLATEHSTGVKHGGRIDTLGLDENNCPVIIEYKRSTNENVINQGLFYLDWLLDHKADFQLLVQKKLGQKTSESIEWAASRMICIAGDYTKYDSYAVEQINRNIELYRYKKFDDLLLFELVNSASDTQPNKPAKSSASKQKYSTVSELLDKADQHTQDLYVMIKEFIMNLGENIQFKELLYYYAFLKIKTFASVEIRPQKSQVIVYVKLDSNLVNFEKGFTRDVSNIGHLGVGNIEIKINNEEDFEKAKSLILKSYEQS
jgi:predicted transport protein